MANAKKTISGFKFSAQPRIWLDPPLVCRDTWPDEWAKKKAPVFSPSQYFERQISILVCTRKLPGARQYFCCRSQYFFCCAPVFFRRAEMQNCNRRKHAQSVFINWGGSGVTRKWQASKTKEKNPNMLLMTKDHSVMLMSRDSGFPSYRIARKKGGTCRCAMSEIEWRHCWTQISFAVGHW